MHYRLQILRKKAKAWHAPMDADGVDPRHTSKTLDAKTFAEEIVALNGVWVKQPAVEPAAFGIGAAAAA